MAHVTTISSIGKKKQLTTPRMNMINPTNLITKLPWTLSPPPHLDWKHTLSGDKIQITLTQHSVLLDKRRGIQRLQRSVSAKPRIVATGDKP